ncbi:deoxyribose-phosphate aldolase [Polaribacter sp.]|nr:deoxyribose-phosphate aldolase [Polaribacter sp.]
MLVRFFFLITFTLFISCVKKENPLTAQQIVDKTLLHSGADKVGNTQIRFQFRDKKYAAIRKNGKFLLERTAHNATSTVRDVLSNEGFTRFKDGVPITVVDSVNVKYQNSINSVHYFSVLPYGLNDKAVQKKLLLSSVVAGKDFYKIMITFSEDGGGEDFEDVFVYWVGKEDFLIDYLAYSFHTNGGGKRFRVLKEQCSKNGIRFVDYHNYQPINSETPLIDLDVSFDKKQLKKVSEIILENIEVTLLKD